MGDKRPREDDVASSASSASTVAVATKRAKTAEEQALISMGNKVKRTSNLQAPIMLLTGHDGAVYSSRFSPDGQHLASGSFDKKILLWDVYGDCPNYAMLSGHTGAVLQIRWSRDGTLLFSASTDRTGGVWDTFTGQRVKKLRGHETFVNAIAPSMRGAQVVATGGDDGIVRLFDLRSKNPVMQFTHKYQITALTMSEAGDQIFAGSLDGTVQVFDLRHQEALYSLTGHTDIITGVELSPDGAHLLTNAMDNTLRLWDVKPFAPTDRLVRVFEGAPHGNEQNLLRCAFSPDGSRVAAGSGDRTAVVWDANTARILYKLPGHKGSVNDVDFHPTEPILLSSGSDKVLFLGELDPKL